jgi:hypothetical protein
VLAAGCARGGHPDRSATANDLRPTFPVATSAPSATPATTVAGTVTPTTVTSRAATTGPSAPASTSRVPPTHAEDAATAHVTDRVGDATPSLLDRPPAWADLAGATLTRTGDQFELRVQLAGGAAPQKTDSDHTMNVASFYDVDDDGNVDYEVWANVADSGWGGSWFDDRNGVSKYGNDAGATWTPDGDAIVMRFDAAHVGNATHFRWSVASEWGRYETLNGPGSVKDDAPDNDQPATFGANG